MQKPHNSIAFLFVLISFSFSLFSCSDTVDLKELEPKELKPKEAKVSDKGEEELLNEAQRYYGNGLYSLAREKFESLNESYPNSTYREFAELKIADTFFESVEYKDAAKSYETFEREHPSSSSAPYALLKTGRSYQLAFKGTGRDTTPLEKSLEIYSSLLEKHSDSIYSPTAKEYKAEVQKELAEQEQFVSNYYSSQEKESAAGEREKEYAKKIGSIDKNALALKKSSEESNEEESESDENDDSNDSDVSDKISTSKGSKLTAPALLTAELINQNQQKINAHTQNANGIAEQSGTGYEEDSATSAPELLTTECTSNGTPTLTLYFNKPFLDNSFIEDNSNIRAKGGVLRLQLPAKIQKREIVDCFYTRDLVIDTDGTLTLQGIHEANLVVLNAPARILMTVK